MHDVAEVFLRRAVEHSWRRLLQAVHLTLGRNPTGHDAPVQENLVPHSDSPFGLLGGEGEVEVVLENEVLHTSKGGVWAFSIESQRGAVPAISKVLFC